MDKSYIEQAKKIVSGLSLCEKIGQLTQIPLSSLSEEGMQSIIGKIQSGQVGSVILSYTAFAGSEHTTFSKKILKQLQQAAINSKSKIPLLFGRDVIHGHKVVYPIPLAMCASFNFDLIEKSYGCIAQQALADGINWTFTPMLDLSRDARWGRIAEGTGEDPYIGRCFAKAAVQGLQGDGPNINMAACAKHYIGYGAAEGGRDYHKAELSDYTLRNYYLEAFDSAVQSGVATVMASFNEISGQPVVSSRYLLTDVLRNELGFDGFVVSDWCAVEQLQNLGVAEHRADCARLAINAGVDMDMVDNVYADTLEALVQQGSLDETLIDQAAQRIVAVKLAMGLFENPYGTVGDYDIEKHSEAAYALCRESCVLLKNKNKILPLDKTAVIAMGGPLLQDKQHILGCWTLDADSQTTVSLYEGIRQKNKNTFIYDPMDDSMRRQFRACDTVIMALGEPCTDTGESRGKADITLPAAQKDALRQMKQLGKKVIGVICAGRPLVLTDIEDCLDAIVYAWHGGTYTGAAVADILFGDFSPCGKLPVSFPRSVGQLPLYYNAPPSGRDCNGYYDETTVIRNYEDCLGAPLYPFGFGLSFTEFLYSDILCENNAYTMEQAKRGIPISIEVTNNGLYDAFETVLLYIRDVAASMTRPLRQLKRVSKIYIKKKETVRICFTLFYEDFGFYDETGHFVVQPGAFEVYIGENALTKHKVKFSLQ